MKDILIITVVVIVLLQGITLINWTLCDAHHKRVHLRWQSIPDIFVQRGERTFGIHFSRSSIDPPLVMNQDQGFAHYAGIILSITVRQKNVVFSGNSSDKTWLMVGGFGRPSEVWALVPWLCSRHSTCQKVWLIAVVGVEPAAKYYFV